MRTRSTLYGHVCDYRYGITYIGTSDGLQAK